MKGWALSAAVFVLRLVERLAREEAAKLEARLKKLKESGRE